MNTSIETREWNYLTAKADLLSEQTKVEFRNGNIKVIDTSKALRKNIKGLSGTQEVLTSATTLKKGLSDWDGNKLQRPENLIMSSINVTWGSHASITDPANVTYSGTTENVPAALMNADVIIRQDDKIVVKQPVFAFLSEQKNTKANHEAGYHFKGLQILLEEKPVQMLIDFPEGVAMPTDKEYFIRIDLNGQKTVAK